MTKADDKKKDAQFREWIQKLPCDICGQFAEYLESGEKRCHAAHWRTAANSGTGIKPLMSCIPMCANHHHEQHQHGTSRLMTRDQWQARVEHYVRQWIRSI